MTHFDQGNPVTEDGHSSRTDNTDSAPSHQPARLRVVGAGSPPEPEDRAPWNDSDPQELTILAW